MNNPEVIRYVNEVVRPKSEQLRDLRDDIANALATRHDGIGAAVTADLAAAVEDGREAQGLLGCGSGHVVRGNLLQRNGVTKWDHGLVSERRPASGDRQRRARQLGLGHPSVSRLP